MKDAESRERRGHSRFRHPIVADAAGRYRRAEVGPEGFPIPTSGRTFQLRVSRRSLRRALEILDVALSEAALAGYEVRLSEDPIPEIVIEVGGVPLAFNVREGQELRTEGPAVPRERHTWHDAVSRYRRTSKRVFSGQLSLVCLESYCEGVRRRWKDGGAVPFETQVASFVSALPQLAEAKRRGEQEDLRQRREWAKERAARQSVRDIEECARIARLARAFDAWQRSRELRRFLAEYRRRLEEAGTVILPGGDLDRWFAWAASYADRLDPTLRPAEPDEFPIADAPDDFEWTDGPEF
jgi:hypothetical protein